MSTTGKQYEYPKGVQATKQAFKELLPAFKSIAPYSGAGLIVGALCLYFSYRFEDHEGALPALLKERPLQLSGILLEHLGAGFIVSAVAVFIYEWGAHIRKAMELSEELVKLRGVMGREALDRGLGVIFGTDKELNQNLKDALVGIKGTVKELDLMNTRKSWANERYIGFVAELLEIVRRNAENLRQLDEKTGWQDFLVPENAASLADSLLAHHMAGLGDGDKYEVISDLVSWQGDQLDVFHNQATKEAVRNGAEIIRVFNCLVPPPATMSRESVKEILSKHLQDVKDWEGPKGYSVKVFTAADYNKIKAKYPERSTVEDAHFGVFTHEEEILCVTVNEANLSKMMLCSKESSVEAYSKILKDVLGNATTLKPEQPNQVTVIVDRLMPKNKRKHK